MLLIAYDCICVSKLLVCGDIKLNPGPAVKEMFASLKSGQDTILSELADIRERLSTTEKTVSSLSAKWTEVEERLLEIREKTLEIESLQTKVQSLKQVIEQQNTTLADLENRSRRCNIIIHGI